MTHSPNCEAYLTIDLTALENDIEVSKSYPIFFKDEVIFFFTSRSDLFTYYWLESSISCSAFICSFRLSNLRSSADKH